MTPQVVALAKGRSLTFEGERVATASVSDPDGAVRRRFTLYRTVEGYVCERVDAPGQLDERRFASRVPDAFEVYRYFGTEPLANYLFGLARLAVPGLHGSVG